MPEPTTTETRRIDTHPDIVSAVLYAQPTPESVFEALTPIEKTTFSIIEGCTLNFFGDTDSLALLSAIGETQPREAFAHWLASVHTCHVLDAGHTRKPATQREKVLAIKMRTMCRRLLFSHMLEVLKPRDDAFVAAALVEPTDRRLYTDAIYQDSVTKMKALQERGDIDKCFDMDEPSVRAKPEDPVPRKKFWDNLFFASMHVQVLCADFAQHHDVTLALPPPAEQEAYEAFLAQQYDNPLDVYGLKAYAETLPQK